MIITALAIALIVRSYIHVCVYLPDEPRRWVASEIVIHFLCLALALAAMWQFHMSIRNALGAAFVADFAVQSRETLLVITDLCKVRVRNWSGERRR